MPSRSIETDSRVPFLGRLFEPVDAGLLVFFRVAFGVLMAWEASRYLVSQDSRSDWIERLYLRPQILFKYFGFEWVSPWPGEGMYYHFWGLGILGLLIAAGCFYRVAISLFFLGFTYVFLLDQATYLNHFYLISLVSFLMIFLPLNCAGSVDAWLWPRIRKVTAPAWMLWLLRFQVGVAYTYGGIAKLNGDWLRGEPMRSWLAERWGHPPAEVWVYFFSWGGVLFDLLIVPALLWPRTRVPAFLAALYFHFSNDLMFQIGVFPWFMIASTLLFMPPDWVQLKPTEASVGRKPHENPQLPNTLSIHHKVVPAFLAFWVAFQTLVPLRHWLYPGNVSWTEEGHRFSWHMKLRSKTASEFLLTAITKSGTRFDWYLSSRLVRDQESGRPYIDPSTREPFSEEFLAFSATNAAGHRLEDITDPALDAITSKQLHGITTKPDMLLQYAHFLGRRLREQGEEPSGLYATVSASLNNRPPQALIDPHVNLLEVERSLAHADWIVPLITPLKPSWNRRSSSQAPRGESDEQ